MRDLSLRARRLPGLSVAPTWQVSEKLDGVRALWDGTRFISKQGKEFFAPPWFCEGLPDEELDGELFLDRGEFQACVSIVRRHDAGMAFFVNGVCKRLRMSRTVLRRRESSRQDAGVVGNMQNTVIIMVEGFDSVDWHAEQCSKYSCAGV